MKDWKKKIEDSAKDVDVPESLQPEAIEKLLEELPARKRARFYRNPAVQFAAAAVVILCIGISIRAAGLWGVSKNSSAQMAATDCVANESTQTTAAGAEEAGAESVQENETAAQTEESADGGAANRAENAEDNADISGYYYTGSYGEIKNIVKETLETSSGWYTMEDGSIGYSETRDAATSGNAAVESEAAAEDPEAEAAEPVYGSDYSGTNLQVEGVDEGDYIKTDGTYIYVLSGNTVKIIDAEKMKLAAQIQQDIEDECGLSEMYIDGEQLILVGTVYQNDLEEMEDDVYVVNSQNQTVLQIYDISDLKKIKKTEEIRQDGYYKTSRKIDDIIYLFSIYDCYIENTENENSLIPRVNGAALAENEIYIPKNNYGSSYLIMSAVDIKDASNILDQKSILNSGNQFYITKNSVYVIQTDCSSEGIIYTVPVRFELKGGKMKGRAASSLRGELTDTFAINESGGYLKVLLTDWNVEGGSSVTPVNRVYVLDMDMNIIGKISDIAPGETIYSARFIGDMGYFVTYRNTDPLFTVDFSEPSDPQIIGELKVTGFSEYLHFYSDDLLLGLGWETDPDSGERIGLKLSMYDISDPTKVTEKDKVIIKNVNYCAAINDYKQILVNPENNLIGFSLESYGQDDNNSGSRYMVFSYDEEEGFIKEMDYTSESVEAVLTSSWYYMMRGLFIKDSFYVVEPRQITAFDRKNSFKETGSLALL